MGHRFHNICFLTVFFVAIFLTLCTRGIAFLGVDFPEWTGISQERSYLEGREYSNFPRVTLEKIASTEFQDEFEQYVSDMLPMKDSAMLLNASLQRTSIKMSSFVFDFDVYPTFYGSNYVYDERQDALYETIAEADSNTANKFELAAELFNDFVLRHDDKKIIFYRVDRMSSSSNNPTNNLINNPVNTEYLSTHFFDLLNEKIKIIDGTLNQAETTKKMFRTDHHWDVSYAYDAYCSIIEELVPYAEKVKYERIDWEKPDFYGAISRSALCQTKVPDKISDYYIDLTGLEIKVDGERVQQDFLDHKENYLQENWTKDIFANRYAEYFHSDYGIIEINNTKADNNRSLLLVGDSFSNNMERFFSYNYENVYVYDARYADCTLDEFLDKHEIQDILFLVGSTNFASDKMKLALSVS